MSGPSAPKAKPVANTQLDYGIKAATAQNELNQVNQVTPTGSLTYTRNGTNADGTPIMTATTALNGAQQGLLDQQTAAQTNAAEASKNIIGSQGWNWVNGPDLTAGGLTNRIMGWGHDYLQPIFDAQNATEEARLANQGIAPGSEAYTRATADKARTQNDAYTQLLLQGVGQAQSAGEAMYMDPLKAISTLSTGAQPTVQYAQTPQAGVQAPDYTTAANNQYNAQKANSDALMGGLFKIPTTILGGWASGGFK